MQRILAQAMVSLVKLLLWLLSLMPSGMPFWLAGKAARLWMQLSPVKRHTTERNLARCYPDADPGRRRQLAIESFRHYLSSILETGQNWYWTLERLQSRCDAFIGEELAREALDSGRGVVVLAPHFGAWEYLGMYLQKLPDIAILYKPPSHPGLERALLEKRRRGGANLIPATASGLRQLYAHLQAGKGAGVLPDQQPSRGQGRFAPFFGNPALTGVLVPRLVQRTGCLVLASVCERLPGGRFRVHMLPVEDEIYSPDMDTSLAAMNRAIERCIAIDPPQYLWSYRRFKAQPEGFAPFYDFR
jgi:KDO2-lipid IV(A) lauroyltransferase